MKRSLRSVESTGDTVTFAAELSASFFGALQDGCVSFKMLFDDHYDKPEILNLLLEWVQGQIASYVEILLPHVSCWSLVSCTFSLFFAMLLSIFYPNNIIYKNAQQMHTAISELSITVLNQLRKACAAAVASGGTGALLKDTHDAFPDMDNFYGGDSGPTIGSLMEVRGTMCA